MRVVSKHDVKPIENPKGEKIYEMIGRAADRGETNKHSFVYVVIPSGKSSAAHYHKLSEET